LLGLWPSAYFPRRTQIYAVITRVYNDNEVDDGSNSNIKLNNKLNTKFPCLYLMKDQNLLNVRNEGVATRILNLNTLGDERSASCSGRFTF
jgi:hypothetical protein